MHDLMMRSSGLVNLDPGGKKVIDFLEEICENSRKEDGFCERFGLSEPKGNGNGNGNGRYEESMDIEEANAAELIMDNGFEEKMKNGDDDQDKEEMDEFEFPLIPTNLDSSPAPADEIFYDGKILPMYVSDYHSQLNRTEVVDKSEETPPPSPPQAVRLPLRLLFLEDREPPSSSCSSSETDELDGVSPGTYCVWNPKTAVTAVAEATGEGECKKSNSTGSSKRLKFRKFLNRSSSEGGRERVAFSTPKQTHKKTKKDETPEVHPKVTPDLMVKKDGEKRRQSPMPYRRRDMVGFFGNGNGTKSKFRFY